MEKEKKSTVVIFFINGINSLLVWNTIVASLDYFANSFSNYSVYSFLPLPLFVAYLVIGMLYHNISNRFKYVSLIITGNILANLALVSIVIVSIVFEQTLLGFILVLLCSFLIGIGTNTTQLTYFAMINYLSQEVVSKYTVGTAVSGLLMTAARAIITGIKGSGEKDNSAQLVLIGFTVALLTFNIFLNIYFCRTSVYKHKIDHFLLHHDKQKEGMDPTISALQQTHHQHHHYRPPEIPQNPSENQPLQCSPKAQDRKKDVEDNKEGKDVNTFEDESSTESEPQNETYVHEEERIESQSYFRTLYETCMQIAPYPFYIMFTFTITFILYPGPTFTKPIQDIDDVWKVIIFNLAYNAGDTLGKYVAEIKNAFDSKSLMFAFFSRLYFFLPITLMAKGSDAGDDITDNKFFPFIICFLFSFTHGFVINSSFIMAFRVAPLTFKKYAGVLCGLLLQVGIMLGTIIQIPFAILFGIED